jgi:hypothetical protein
MALHWEEIWPKEISLAVQNFRIKCNHISFAMFAFLIMAVNTANCFQGDIELPGPPCGCNCGIGRTYTCNKYASKPYAICGIPARTKTAVATKTQVNTLANTPVQSPFTTPDKTPARSVSPSTPVKTHVPTVSQSTLLPTGTRPYLVFVTCKPEMFPKTWFLLILGLI